MVTLVDAAFVTTQFRAAAGKVVGRRTVNREEQHQRLAINAKAADGRDHVAVFLKRFEQPGEFVLLARLSDLVVGSVNAVGQVDKGATSRRGSRLRRAKRSHTFTGHQFLLDDVLLDLLGYLLTHLRATNGLLALSCNVCFANSTMFDYLTIASIASRLIRAQ